MEQAEEVTCELVKWVLTKALSTSDPEKKSYSLGTFVTLSEQLCMVDVLLQEAPLKSQPRQSWCGAKLEPYENKELREDKLSFSRAS